MALAAAQVIDAINALVLPLPALGGRAYTSRAWPLTTLPAARTTAEDERMETGMLDGTNRHQLEVAMRIFAEAVDDLDDVLHGLAAGALALVFAGTPPHNLQLTGMQRELASDGQATLGVITIRMSASYYVQASAPETIL